MSPTDPLTPSAATGDAPLLTVSGLRKSFGDHEVLRSIDLEVRTGQVVALIGPSGSGKTTVLRSLNGLETPDAGRITVGEHVAIDFSTSLSPKDFRSPVTLSRGTPSAGDIAVQPPLGQCLP